jgi:hypothetical protein
MKLKTAQSSKASHHKSLKDTLAFRILNFMHFDGQIKFPVSDDSVVTKEKMLEHSEKQLKIERARNILRKGNILTFSGRIFRFKITANFLSVTDAGFIRVTENENQLIVDYRLSFWVIFIYCVL